MSSRPSPPKKAPVSEPKPKVIVEQVPTADVVGLQQTIVTIRLVITWSSHLSYAGFSWLFYNLCVEATRYCVRSAFHENLLVHIIELVLIFKLILS